MSQDIYKLEVEKRDPMTKGELKRLRREGKIPGIFYSHDSKNSIPFTIDRQELIKIHKSGARLMTITVGNKKRTVIFRTPQYHPVTDEVMHIDLYGVKMDVMIQITVSLELVGEPIGVREEAGQLTQPLQILEVECLPSDIPEALEVDVSELHMNESVQAGAVQLPENVTLVTSEDTVVAMVSHGVREEETVTAEEEGEDLLFEEEGETDGEDQEPSDDSKSASE